MPAPVLLVIDVVNDVFNDPLLAAHRPRVVHAINRLAGAFRRSGRSIIWVRQEFKPDLSDAFLDVRRRRRLHTIADTPGAQFVSELDVHPSELVLIKKRYSAFFGTSLDQILAALDPGPLVMAGVNTHACIRTTAIDAYQRDMDVVIADDGVASYDVEHDRMTRRYLNGKIARFLTTAEIEALVARQGA